MFPKRTVLHICLDVMKLTEVKYIYNDVFNGNQARKAEKSSYMSN